METSLDLREASLIGRITDIVKAKYRQKDFYGPDVSALDVPALHANAHLLSKPSRNPHVFLVMKEKFQAAGCAAMLENFGCRVTVCFNGREAYTKHLRRNAARFDLAIVEWDMPDVNGRDLVHYCRTDGSSLCFLALVANETLPGMAIRGGANLFLRTPLCIHMHVIRKLLLPPEITGTGFPTHVLVSRSHFPEMSHVLGTIRSKGDEDVQMLISEAISQLRDGEVDDHEVIETIVDNLKRALAHATTGAALTASDKQVARLQKVVRDVLAIAKDTKTASSKVTEENRSLRSQLKECLLLHRYTPLNDKAKMDELETFSKTELKQRIAVLQRQQMVHLERIDKLTSDNAQLVQLNDALDRALEELREGDLHNPLSPSRRDDTTSDGKTTMDVSNQSFSPSTETMGVSFAAKGRRNVESPSHNKPGGKAATASPPGRNRFMSMADLRASFTRKPRPKVKVASPQEIAESLERAMMAREDSFSSVRPNIDAVPINISWSTARAVPLQEVYAPVARIMEELNTHLNSLSSRLLASYPKVRPRLVEFAKDVHALFNNTPPAKVFIRPQPTFETPTEKSPTKTTAASPSRKMIALRQSSIQLLLHSVQTSLMHRHFIAWKLLRVMRRGFVSSVEEERLMRKTRANKELVEAKVRADKLDVQLSQANSVIRELKLQLDAAWQPPPMASLPPEPEASSPTTVASSPNSPRVPSTTSMRSIGLSPIPFDNVVVPHAPLSGVLPPPRTSAMDELPEAASPPRRTVSTTKGRASSSNTTSDSKHPPPQPAVATLAPPGKAEVVNVEVPVAVPLRTAPDKKSSKSSKSKDGAKTSSRSSSSKGAAVNAPTASVAQPTTQQAAAPAPPSQSNPSTGSEQLPNARVSQLEEELSETKATLVNLEAIVAEKDATIQELRELLERTKEDAASAASRPLGVDDSMQVSGNIGGSDDFLIPGSVLHGREGVGTLGVSGTEVGGSRRPSKNSSRRSVEFLADDFGAHPPTSEQTSRSDSIVSLTGTSIKPSTTSTKAQHGKRGSTTSPPQEPHADGSIVPIVVTMDTSKESTSFGSVMGTAECVLERKSPNSAALNNPFLTKPLTTALSLDDSPLDASPSDILPMQPHVTPRLSFLKMTQPSTAAVVAAAAAAHKAPHPQPPPSRDTAMSSFLPQLTPRSTSALSPASVPLRPEEGPRSPLPPVHSKPVGSPRAVPLYGGPAAVGDSRDALKSLLMAQSARGPANHSAMGPAVTPRGTASSPEVPSAAQAKKLFAKLGIGKMPKVNPKPQQLSSDFALMGRH